jgi:hypothetical protein
MGTLIDPKRKQRREESLQTPDQHAEFTLDVSATGWLSDFGSGSRNPCHKPNSEQALRFRIPFANFDGCSFDAKAALFPQGAKMYGIIRDCAG